MNEKLQASRRRQMDGAAGLLLVAAVAMGPGVMLWRMHGLWNADGAYAYAWVAPFLAAYLCRCRWEDRPAPGAPLRGAWPVAIALALATLPACWLREAAPERGICAWTYAAASVGTALALIAMVGGGAWLRWFAFPVAFLLTAVPWPHGLEALVTNPLMRKTAGVTVEVLLLLGVPAAQSGNLVHIENGVIDIDEACSGIRSLQAMVMVAFFLGELFRLKPARRIGLLALGLALTLAANILRTVALSGLGYGHGMAAVDRWHDAAGFAVLAISLLGTLAVAFLIRTEKRAAADASRWTVPVMPCAALITWFIASQVAVEGWYRLHEPPWHGWSWTVQWPEDRASFHWIKLPDRSLRLLMCDDARAATWRDAGDWSIYCMRWNPGNPQAEAAKVHRPDVCLNAEGAIMQDDLGIQVIPVGRMQIPFHSYTFRLGDKTLHVFYCLSEEAPGPQPIVWNPQFEEVDMFQRALEGRRRFGLQSLEVALSGYDSEQSAVRAFKAGIGALVTPRVTNK